MKVRRANYDDIPAIVDLMEEYHPKSNLADIPFDRYDAIKILNHHVRDRTCRPLVAINDDGTINGILIAELAPFFFNKKHTFVTDLCFISNGAGVQLLAALKKWFSEIGADRIIMGVSSGDPRADAFLELSGLEKTGSMYVFLR